MALYVIDDKTWLPEGKEFDSRCLTHSQIVDLLKPDKYWKPCFTDYTSSKADLLRVLWRETGRTLDPGHDIEDHKCSAADVQRFGRSGSVFVLIRDDEKTFEVLTLR